jgi:hypothetical protein
VAHETLERIEGVRASTHRALGVVFAVVFVVIGLFPWLHGAAARPWALMVGGGFALAALLLPDLLAPLNRAWTRLGALLHRVMSPVVLGIMFFLVITPMAIVMRWFREDPLRRRFDPRLPSYWIERRPDSPTAGTFTDQF